MKKAKQIATGVPNLKLTVGGDGVWLHFKAKGRKILGRKTSPRYASINLTLLAEEKCDVPDNRIAAVAPIWGPVLAWCLDMQGGA